MSLVLRPYQGEAVQQLREAIRAGYRRIVLVSPTGSGKTEMGFEIIRGAVGKGRKVGFMANRVNLVDQTSRRLTKAGLEHGIVQSSNSCREWMKLLVCSIQTVAKRGLIDKFDVILIDEAHASAGSKDYRKLVADHKDKVVIGLTATPFAKGMGRDFKEVGGALWEHLVVAATPAQLVAEGYLVDCDVYAPSEPDMSAYKARKNAAGELDYSDEDAGKAMSKGELVGDIVEHWRRLANDTPTVCFASTIAHSKMIVERFRAAGVKAEHIDCYTDDDERRAILRRVESGETRIISNVGILCEGWDFPACKTLILARPTRSLIRFMQMAGRVLRPSPGKGRALILDHSGTVTRLGFPTDDREYVLDDGKPKEAAASNEEENEVKLKACPKCGHVDREQRNPCVSCGHTRAHQPKQVEESDGQLKKLERGAKAKEKYDKDKKQAMWSQLLHHANAKGYKPGWAANVYREWCGVWPRGLSDMAMEPSQEMKNFLTYRAIKHAKSHNARAA